MTISVNYHLIMTVIGKDGNTRFVDRKTHCTSLVVNYSLLIYHGVFIDLRMDETSFHVELQAASQHEVLSSRLKPIQLRVPRITH